MPSSNFLLYVDARFVSPYAMSAFVTLHERGLPFDIKMLNLAAQENKEPSLAAASLTRLAFIVFRAARRTMLRWVL